MPDIPYSKYKPRLDRASSALKTSGGSYVELQALSNFSFLKGGSHPEELVWRAKELGCLGIGIADEASFAGVVRAHRASLELGLPLYVGAKLSLIDDISSAVRGSEPSLFSIIAYAPSLRGYNLLSSFISTSILSRERDDKRFFLSEFLRIQGELILILSAPDFIGRDRWARFEEVSFYDFVSLLKENSINDNLSLALSRNYYHGQRDREELIGGLSRRFEIPMLATNDVLYHSPERKDLQDVLTCIRLGTNLNDAGFELKQNAERHLKSPDEMSRLFRDKPYAIRRSVELADRLGFSPAELKYEYPDEICPHGERPIERLASLTRLGAEERYPGGIPEKVQRLIHEELDLIKELGYEKYFLTCHDIVSFARSQNILCQGRGAAANSAVCFCLGITSVDPAKIDLLFARFVSKERNEPPDIDIDFEHERREEVIQYIYKKFGRSRAAIAAEVITYRARSAVRDVGKAFGLPLKIVDGLAKSIHRWTNSKIIDKDFIDLGLDPNGAIVRHVLRLSSEILGFPRHLSQHVGGFVISNRPLNEIVPIIHAGMESRSIIEWDKDDIDTLQMLKIDILALGMLSCIRRALDLVNVERAAGGQRELELHSIPAEDQKVYDMICRADTVGVFQIESRAQMSMLTRLKPRCFYDLVIEVAIVRPGPIQGNMVHPYLKRRAGLERPFFPDERVRDVLGKTLGVPLFQEQAMRLAIVLADFSPGEAEKLRRAMSAWKKNKKLIETFQARIVGGMTKNGYSQDFALSCVNQIKGFSEYGFPESHAASFALLVYASAWLKCHYPAHFAAALLNSQPMGFYAPAQIVADAKAHGIAVEPADILKSAWDSTVTSAGSIRLGLRLVRGLEKKSGEALHKTSTLGSFGSLREFWLRAKSEFPFLRKSSLRLLARADAFASFGLNRREALWEIHALPSEPLPLDEFDRLVSAKAPLPQMSLQESMFDDYRALGLSLKAHPIFFIRRDLERRLVKSAVELKTSKTLLRTRVSAAGIVVCRQRPGTAKGVVFLTLEDETGTVNLIIKPDVFEKYQREVISSSALLAAGALERVGDNIYINAADFVCLDKDILPKKPVPLPSKSFSY